MTDRRRPRRQSNLPPLPDVRPDEVSLDGAPHQCGGTFRLVSAPTPVPIRDREIVVEQEQYRCDRCNEIRIDLWQIDAARAAAATRLNEVEGLLQPSEIKSLRESLGLSQADFEKALGLGAKTVVRWETGKVMPSRATALLLLLIRRDPSAFDFLSRLPESSGNSGATAHADAVVMRHQGTDDQKRRAMLDELTREAHRLGLGY